MIQGYDRKRGTNIYEFDIPFSKTIIPMAFLPSDPKFPNRLYDTLFWLEIPARTLDAGGKLYFEIELSSYSDNQNFAQSYAKKVGLDVLYTTEDGYLVEYNPEEDKEIARIEFGENVLSDVFPHIISFDSDHMYCWKYFNSMSAMGGIHNNLIDCFREYGTKDFFQKVEKNKIV